MKNFALPLLAAAALAAPAPAPAQATMQVQPIGGTRLDVAATGEVTRVPDVAIISTGVVTRAQTATAAIRANAARMERVRSALRAAGIADKDIQTSNLNLSPQYRYQENQPPVLVGYQASNTVTVTVHDLKRLGQAVDATVSAGANQVHGVSFGLEDRTAAENAAREDAVRALAAKAELYARATGHRITRLVSLSEGGGSYPVPPPMPMMEAASFRGKAADTSISPGELTVRVDVSGLYELSR